MLQDRLKGSEWVKKHPLLLIPTVHELVHRIVAFSPVLGQLNSVSDYFNIFLPLTPASLAKLFRLKFSIHVAFPPVPATSPTDYIFLEILIVIFVLEEGC
jgi:hypothetical protein